MATDAKISEADSVEKFIVRWSDAPASERANAQLFLTELCEVLDVPRPDPAADSGYSFEYPVTHQHPDGSTSTGRIDLYKRGCLVLEAKHFKPDEPKPDDLAKAAALATGKKKKSGAPARGTDAWDAAMLTARGQAERYVRSLPASEPNPPFMLVVDIGDTFEVFADFTQAGKAYLPFPEPRTFRFRLADLRRDEIRERLRLIWTNPLSLDPSRVSARVTREVSKHLATLAISLEKAGHAPGVVAQFLTRCLFCMFAEDVGLLPDRGFSGLLKSIPDSGEGFVKMMNVLFAEMQKGTDFSVVLRKKLLRFNGGLFEDCTVLPVNADQLALLREAAGKDWRHVEPAIFGTLLERALGGEGERHKLGAHFTPRAYVERLVLPTIIEPLRAEWENVRVAAVARARAGNLDDARKEVIAFHDRLRSIRILDTACGSANFLYVALEHMKRLEGEVLDFAAGFGENFFLELSTHAVDPHQFLGIEINPRAAAIAELVLWIGYLQWHFRTRGNTLPEEPVLKKFRNIECRDAVLAYDGEPQPARDEKGNVITVWDRRSEKVDPVTGRKVPDETKRVPLLTYANPRPAIWPDADFIIGNPPFIGTARMREDLGDGYAETLRAAYPSVPESADFVMYWWNKAAELVRAGKVRRFGLITTNSLRQTFARRVVQTHMSAKPPLSLVFAIPDHPWVDTAECAAVRIAMTVGEAGEHDGELLETTDEQPQDDGATKVAFKSQRGKIMADLTVGANVTSALELKANEGMSCPGVQLMGEGFIVTGEEAKELGLGNIVGLEKHIRPYRNGRDLADVVRGVYVIDLFGLSSDEVRQNFPAVYQRVFTRVKPERETNNRASYREKWWIFGEPVKTTREALDGLPRYIATIKTAKHRVFQFLSASIIPDSKLISFASDDALMLGVLSSRIHCLWALAAGSWLGVGNDPTYVKSASFEKFPFPACGEAERERIRKIAEELDAHRKRVQAKHPGLTLTGMYNVLEKLRGGGSLTAKEKKIHDDGLVSVLKQLHDDLDAAVAAAYGWPATLTDAEILERTVALNAERAREEEQGIVRWLRPDYQTRGQKSAVRSQTELALPVGKSATKKAAGKAAWPETLSARVSAVESSVRAAGVPVSAATIATNFKRARAADISEILETLCALGRIHRAPASDHFIA